METPTRIGLHKAGGVKSLLALLALAVLAVPSLGESPEERGLEIARQVRASRAGFVGESGNVELTLVNASGDRIVRRMELVTSEKENDGDRSLVTFEKPPDVKGVQLLTWTHKGNEDDQWLFLPTVKRVKRISSSNKSGSFMGSEFAFEDMGGQEVEKYSYRFLEEGTLEGRGVWVVERVPVDKTSGYSRQLVSYDKEYLAPLKIEYFDRRGQLLKVAHFEQYQQFGGKWWRANQIRIENVQTRKSSILAYGSDRKLQVAFEPDRFETARMGQ
ncbi:MAG TPA: outer membrane lipoprotein-sorting protein [Thermoanaerobaculia bacterium]|nr:outer membrane lipoprotein-sorting protein [Thermoanaerobaculia bacterium]